MGMKLSVCMIVKNEEKNLAKTLPGLSRYADEVILVDTGSSDRTVELAEKYEAKVYHFAWISDFAAARNESLKHAGGDWVLWVDADEYLSEDDLKTLRSALEASEAVAHELTLYESGYGKREKKFNYQRVKAFRNGKGYHFVRPINEQLVDGKGQIAKGPAIPVSIYHWGRDLQAEQMNEKRQRYLELYSRALEKDPNDAYFHFLLANVLRDLKRFEEAVTHYRRVVELSKDSYVVRQSLEKIAQARLSLKDYQGAAQAVKDLLGYDPENIAGHNVYATLLLFSKKADAAIQILTEVLNRKLQGPAENPYQAQALPNLLLGKAYEMKDQKEKAQECFKRARELYPYAGGDS